MKKNMSLFVLFLSGLPVLLLFQNCSGGYQSIDANVGSSTDLSSTETPSSTPPTNPPPTQPPASSAPNKPGYTIQIAEYFAQLDLSKWAVQSANTPAATNLSSDPNNAFGEVQANLPNQYKILPEGGIRIVSKPQVWGNIGGVPNKTCADATSSSCKFLWTSSLVTGKSGMQSSYGYYEWSLKLPAVPEGGIGTWPATWLLGGYGSLQYQEIDFMERFSTDPEHISFTLHYGSGVGDFGNTNSHEFCKVKDMSGNKWADKHTFAIDWQKDFIRGYVDGVFCGEVRQGQTPNQYGPHPVIIPSGNMFPIFNTAISPNVNSATAQNPVHFDVLHYLYYSNDSIALPPKSPLKLTNLRTEKAFYNPGEVAKVLYNLTAGPNQIVNPVLSGVAIFDFLGDSSGFQQGSSVNDTFGGWFYFPLTTTIQAGQTYAGSFDYQVPANMPVGVYTIYIGKVETAAGVHDSNFGRLVVGENALPPAP